MDTLIIDHREPEYLIDAVSFVANQEPGLKFFIDKLEYGDYLFLFDSFKLGIERKEVGDLLNSLAADRLRPQLAGLLTTVNTPYLLIEGALSQSPDGHIIAGGRETQWRASALHAFLYSIQEQHIRLALVPSQKALPERLMGLYRYYANPDHHDLTNDRYGVLHFRSNPSVEMLSQVPGIGYDTARKLLKTFGTVADVGAASVEELQKAPGIGKQKAYEIHAAFHTPYREKKVS